ncbi:MAG: tol-pal system-associated acyl-CoA thioesterase [Thalassotalea sp.]
MSDITDKHPIRVYYEDTDAGGIVYYANYLKFFERARTEFLRARGINQSDFLEQNIGFVVRKVEMDNLASAKLDDLLIVTSQIRQLKGASLVFEQQITTEAQILLCTAKVRIACVNLALAKPCAIPETILGALKRVS